MNSEFSTWLSESNIECNCKPGPVENGNGLIFQKEKVNLVSVPKDKVITAEMIVNDYAPDHKLLQILLHRTDQGETTDQVELIPRKIIARFLLYQILSIRRGTPDLKFASWIRSLPPARDINLPTSWDDEDIDTLETTSIFFATVSKKKHLLQTYSKFFKSDDIREAIAYYVKSGGKENQELKDTDCEITIQDWLLVDQWISSRSLSIPDDDGSTRPAMVPVVDLANHATMPTAVYQLNEEEGVDLIGLSPKEGEEITINYGPEMGAAEFLFKYGFVPEGRGARSITFFHDLLDPKFRQCLDEEYDPEKEKQHDNDDDDEEIDPDSSYELLFTLYNQRQNRTIFTDVGGGPATWHDDFICLHCCGSDIELVHDPDQGYLALHFQGEPMDLNNVEQFLRTKDPKYFETVVKPRGNRAITNLINKFYLIGDNDKAHFLHGLEQKLLQSVINEAKKNSRAD